MNTPKVDLKIAEYEKFIRVAMMYVDAGEGTPLEAAYLGLGLVGEAGEVADMLKKAIRNGVDEYPGNIEKLRPMLIDELGDVLWYFMQLLRFLDTDLEAVIDHNTTKLQKRIEEGTIGNLIRKHMKP